MGLNLNIKGYKSKNDKIGSYGGFMAFRLAWANHLGIDLYEMTGFGGKKLWTKEPLKFFFNHSDYDGSLTPKQCAEILKQAKKDFPKLKEDYQCAYSFPILIEFCKQSIKTNKKINFC